MDLVLSFVHSNAARMGVRIFEGTAQQCLKKMKVLVHPDKVPTELRERATRAFQELGNLAEYAGFYGTYARAYPTTELETRLLEQLDIAEGRRPVPSTTPESSASGPSVGSAGAPAQDSEEQASGC